MYTTNSCQIAIALCERAGNLFYVIFELSFYSYVFVETMDSYKRTASPLEQQNGEKAKKVKVQVSPELEKDGNMGAYSDVVRKENYDYLFDDDNDFDFAGLDTPKNQTKFSKLDLSKWQRCIVKEIQRDRKACALILTVKSEQPIDACSENKENTNGMEHLQGTCYLKGPWSTTEIEEGDVVSLKAKWDNQLDSFYVDKDEGFCVVNPDTLIPATVVVGSLFCRRKAVLQDRFRGIDANSKTMVVGSLAHELLQNVLRLPTITNRDQIKKIAQDLLNSYETAYMLYSNQLRKEDILPEILEFVSTIHNFLRQYLQPTSPSMPMQVENFQGRICDIEDIEQNLWVPQLGLKGKIDVSARVRKTYSLSGNQEKSLVLPLELKTGRASFSMEHKGQIILYQMMLTAIGKPTQSGLLLYLRECIMREITGSRNEQRDLIALRNDLSRYLTLSSSNRLKREKQSEISNGKYVQPLELPEPISHPTACIQCPYNTLCCTFAQTDPDMVLSTDHHLKKVMKDGTNHLNNGDYDYFLKWCHILIMEEQESRKNNFIAALWTQTPDERQRSGKAVCNLILSSKEIKIDEARFIHQFNVNNVEETSSDNTDSNFDLTISDFSVGEYVTVSTAKYLAVACGLIMELSPCSIAVSLERNLLQNYANCKFIIDKYESQVGNVFNLTNLSLMLDNTERSRQLREIIIERHKPNFLKTLPKIVSRNGAEILKHLNSVQRKAVLKALTTESFMLIKGLPGTGKTQTLVAIIRLLDIMGKSLIITSHTHMAVDNLLLRLKSENVRFLRLGSVARIHPLLREFSEMHILANCRSETDLSKVYNSFNIIGVSCLGTSHPIFLHRRFDFCIVDEATQVMQPTVLRPLYFCDRFVLVGDPDQLPPFVRSLDARQNGAEESLFQRLDCEEATSVLTLQYRMNKTITRLANILTYKGQLQCASDDIKNAKMKVSIVTEVVSEKWLQRALQGHIDQSVVFLDTTDCLERSLDYAQNKLIQICSTIEQTFSENEYSESTTYSETKLQTVNKRLSKYTNYCEAAVVIRLIEKVLSAGYKSDRVGVIAPYRAQVKLLRKLAEEHHEYYKKNGRKSLDFNGIEVNTVDQYQGRDKDIVIYSCSRTGRISTDIRRARDFEILEDNRRLTVAITRAKHKLIIVGDAACVQQYSPFKILIDNIPGLCKISLHDGKFGFQWQSLLDNLSRIIK
uniref:DNA replication ATP-dependent helicase/nuclease n=1 Tax=Glossina brevipalpis TaxID=37001 RepID=A0A1A9W184_9MUSC